MGQTRLVQGGLVFSITIEPKGVSWFYTSGVRATVTDLDNSDQSHRVLFTAVRIGNNGKEAFDEVAPVAPTLAAPTIAGKWSDDYNDPDGWATPVGWGLSSNIANSQPLTLYGIALGLPVTTNLLVSISCTGTPAHAPFA